MITLQNITVDNLGDILDLKVSNVQEDYIASNAKSLAEAHFYAEAWYRAIYADDQPVGFVMLADERQLSPLPDNPKIIVWRFMIDAKYQGKGYGRAAMLLIIDYVKSRQQFEMLELSFHAGKHSPEKFYLSLGYQLTGEMRDGEHVMAYLLV